MCLLPNNRASMDHAPGPIIAKLAPRVANIMAGHASAELEKAIHISIVASNVPASGVQRPTRRNKPVLTAKRCGIVAVNSAFPFRCAAPK
jgi:hypothetical protein